MKSIISEEKFENMESELKAAHEIIDELRKENLTLKRDYHDLEAKNKNLLNKIKRIKEEKSILSRAVKILSESN